MSERAAKQLSLLLIMEWGSVIVLTVLGASDIFIKPLNAGLSAEDLNTGKPQHWLGTFSQCEDVNRDKHTIRQTKKNFRQMHLPTNENTKRHKDIHTYRQKARQKT